MAATSQSAKNKRRYLDYMSTVMQQLEWDLHDRIYNANRIPPLWRDISESRFQTRKTRITLGVDENIVKFFKSMGNGFQQRMNDVLASWMYARLAGLLEGEDTAPEFRGRPAVRPAFEPL